MNYEIFNYDNEEIEQAIKDDINTWSCGLWWDDLEEAAVARSILIWDDNDIVAFQTINSSNETIAIEVKDTHKGKGLSRLMIEESGSYIPERDENPEFWAWALEQFGED